MLDLSGLIAFVVNLAILCIVLAILYWIVIAALSLLPADRFPVGKVGTIVQILFAVIFLLWLLSYFSGAGQFRFYGGR